MAAEQNKYPVLYLIATVIFGLYLTAVVLNIRDFWGINIARFLPAWWQWLTIIIIVLSFVPSLAQHFYRFLDFLSDRLGKSKKLTVWFSILMSFILFVIWLSFYEETKFLGDGYLRIKQITNGQLWLLTEIGDFFIHAALFRYILEPLGVTSVALSYHIVSALCGVIFLLGAYKLARYLDPSRAILFVLLMFSSGMTVMFFGYVESYSILAALVPYLILLGLKVIDGTGKLTMFILLFLLAGLMHPVAPIILSGLLISTLVILFSATVNRADRILRWLILMVILGIVIIYLLRSTGIVDTGLYLLPLLPYEGYNMAILTWHHLLNLFNWMLLSSMISLPMIYLLHRCELTDNNNDRIRKHNLFALSLVVPALLFMLFFTPQLGGARDWDLFSLPAFLVIPALLILYSSRSNKSFPVAIFPVIVTAFCVALSFAAVNSTVIGAANRFEEIIEVGRFKNLYKEYLTLYNLSAAMPQLEDRKLGYALQAWSEPPYNKEDSINITSQLADIYLERGDKLLSRKYIGYMFSIDSANLGAHLLLIRYLQKYGGRAELLNLAERMSRLFSDNALGLMNAAIIFLHDDQQDKGQNLLRQAYEADSTNTAVMENYAVLQYRVENYDRCIELMERVLKQNPTSFTACYHAAAAFYQMGDFARSYEYLRQAANNQKTREDAEMVGNLKQALNSRR